MTKDQEKIEELQGSVRVLTVIVSVLLNTVADDSKRAELDSHLESVSKTGIKDLSPVANRGVRETLTRVRSLVTFS